MEGTSRTARFVDVHARLLENLFETVGLWRISQRIRRRVNHHFPLSPRDCERLKMWIQDHFDLDLTIQRLARYQLKQRYPSDESASFTSECSSDGELVALEDKIAAYKHNAFLLQRVLQIDLDEFPNGPVKRAIMSLRRNSKWNNSKWLRLHCAQRGGCCARECGCCQNPRAGVKQQGTGHCTSACICCEDVRGFHIDSSEGNPSDPFRATGALDVYDVEARDAWLKAFVWGL